jgi:hypothetical protein
MVGNPDAIQKRYRCHTHCTGGYPEDGPEASRLDQACNLAVVFRKCCFVCAPLTLRRGI